MRSMRARTRAARGGEGGISLPAVRATAEQRPPALARGAGSAPPADHGSEAGAPSAQAPRGRAPRFEDLEGREFEELVLNTAARILARHHGNTATLRPVQVLEETGLRGIAVVHYSAVVDVLLRNRELDGWRLVRVKRKEGKLVYLRYVRTTVRCPLCGKLLRRRSAASHARSHLERLERAGVFKLERADGRWLIVLHDGRKIYGASWLTLLKLVELGVVNGG